MTMADVDVPQIEQWARTDAEEGSELSAFQRFPGMGFDPDSGDLVDYCCLLLSVHGLPAPDFCTNAAGGLGRNLERSLRGDWLLNDVARARGVDFDTGAHRRRERHRADVAPLRRRWLRADQFVDHGGIVLQ